jgi:plasmid stability protein
VTNKAETTRRGRPSKPDAVRLRRPVAVRLRDELRADLEISSARHGRSVSEEIEARLESSLAVQNHLKQEWGNDIYTIAQASRRSSIAMDLLGTKMMRLSKF